ncbi:hypothetical protein CBS101457_000855 [Exobasidium rhododendri]|nr:hypothetical protein CBS101457_000855 [Exobasidium rhododendri]
MMGATSKLWSRRMTNRVQDTPSLSPLYSTSLSPTSAFPTDCSPTPPLRPPISSPALYTPTEAVGILMGQSPVEAADSTRLAVEVASASMQKEKFCYSSPCSPALDGNHLPEMAAGEDWTSYLLRSLSCHQDDLKFEIDTAALATEVALHVLTPDHEIGRQDRSNKLRKMRLLPLSVVAMSASDSTNHISDSTADPHLEANDRPVRKGRARMSQEKRKRLARRKEREALLLGIPPKPVSAPAHVTQFPLSSLGGQPLRSGLYIWNHQQQQQRHSSQWLANRNKGQHDSGQSIGLHRSTSGSDDHSSRESVSPSPSLAGDESICSTATSASPQTSPELDRRSRYPSRRSSKANPWTDDAVDTSVPRLSLQPPSPQQVRSSGGHRPPPSFAVPVRPRVAVSSDAAAAAVCSPPSSANAPPMMRWSTTSGLMTSEGISLASKQEGPSTLSKFELPSSNETTHLRKAPSTAFSVEM